MKNLLVLFITYVYVTHGYAQSNTIENLRKAYVKDAQASYQFDQYSDKARQEGYDDLSRLFCAISNAELIQMKNQHLALHKLRVEPGPVSYEQVKVSSTTQNLKQAIQFEAAEKQITRTYIKEAKKENIPTVANLFKKTRKNEAGHEYHLKKALFNLDKFIPEDYFVSNKTGEILSQCQCVSTCECEAPPKPKYKDEAYLKF